MSILAWLIGSRIGRLLGVAVAAIAAVAGVFLAGRRAGADRAENKALRKRMDDMDDAKEVRDEIDGLDPDDVRRRLDGWMRDDD